MPLVFKSAHLEKDPTSDLPGTHFPKLAFRKLVRLGGVAARGAFTPHERKRLERRFPTWVRKMPCGKIEVTAKAWMDLHELGVDPNTLNPLLESGEHMKFVA